MASPDVDEALVALRLRVEEQDRLEDRARRLRSRLRSEEAALRDLRDRLAALDADLDTLRGHDLLSVLARIAGGHAPMVERRESERAAAILQEGSHADAVAQVRAELEEVEERLAALRGAKEEYETALADRLIEGPPSAEVERLRGDWARGISYGREIGEAIDAAGSALASARELKRILFRFGGSPTAAFLVDGLWAAGAASVQLDEAARQARRLRARLIRLQAEMDDLQPFADADPALPAADAQVQDWLRVTDDLVAKRKVQESMVAVERMAEGLAFLMKQLTDSRDSVEQRLEASLREMGRRLESRG